MEDDPFDPVRMARALRGRVMVAGVGGGVGTTTVARALGGIDRGVFTGRQVDVLVCRATGDSLVRAARVAALIAGESILKPVLAVSPVDASGPSRPAVARLQLLEPHTAAVVVLPYVRRWRDLATPLDDLTGLLTRPPSEVPRPLRHFAAAVTAVHAALHPDEPSPPSPRRSAPASVHRPAVRALPTPRRTR